MKRNKFKTNKLTAAASQDQIPKPQQEYVFSNLPVSGIQGQTEMKHTKFKTNKLTTAACTKQGRKRQDFKKGFLWCGSDGVNHVAREVLQHGVANRGSPHRRTVRVDPPRHSQLFRRGGVAALKKMQALEHKESQHTKEKQKSL